MLPPKAGADKPQGEVPRKKPRTKQDAIRDMVEKDPEEAARFLRQILRGK